jgi:hypothetical protein
MVHAATFLKTIFLGATIAAAIAMPATADELQQAPIKVSTKWDEGISSYFVRVTSTSDEVDIISVIANRGNCEDITVNPGNVSLKSPLSPTTLKFGEAITRRFSCIAIELTVETNKGSWTYHPEAPAVTAR